MILLEGEIMEDKIGLCYRCEHRARYLETGGGPRAECKSEKSTVYSCYSYRPIKPVVTSCNEGDDRPAFGPPMLAGRVHAVRIADGKYHLHQDGDELTPYFLPDLDRSNE